MRTVDLQALADKCWNTHNLTCKLQPNKHDESHVMPHWPLFTCNQIKLPLIKIQPIISLSSSLYLMHSLTLNNPNNNFSSHCHGWPNQYSYNLLFQSLQLVSSSRRWIAQQILVDLPTLEDLAMELEFQLESFCWSQLSPWLPISAPELTRRQWPQQLEGLFLNTQLKLMIMSSM